MGDKCKKPLCFVLVMTSEEEEEQIFIAKAKRRYGQRMPLHPDFRVPLLITFRMTSQLNIDGDTDGEQSASC